MTDREKAIVMAYTGYCMLTGDKLSVFYEYVESIMGRPVYTHEMGIKAVDDEIKEKAKADFIALCAGQEPCDDAISRHAAIDAIWDGVNMDIFTREVKECLEALPPVTPVEKTGRWIDTGSGQECSECGEIQYGYDNFRHFCANCGRRMEVGG